MLPINYKALDPSANRASRTHKSHRPFGGYSVGKPSCKYNIMLMCYECIVCNAILLYYLQGYGHLEVTDLIPVIKELGGALSALFSGLTAIITGPLNTCEKNLLKSIGPQIVVCLKQLLKSLLAINVYELLDAINCVTDSSGLIAEQINALLAQVTTSLDDLSTKITTTLTGILVVVGGALSG